MRYSRILCVLLAVSFAFSLMAKKPKDKNKYGVYMVGVAASFQDSLVYMTDVQFVDSAQVDGKGFLVERAQYSEQLHEFFGASQGDQHRTCFVLFNRKKKHIDKEANKLLQKYKKAGNSLIKPVDASFKFKKATIY